MTMTQAASDLVVGVIWQKLLSQNVLCCIKSVNICWHCSSSSIVGGGIAKDQLVAKTTFLHAMGGQNKEIYH